MKQEKARLEHEEEERQLIDVSLRRSSTQKDCGLNWNMAGLIQGQLEVVAVNCGTPLESWNREQCSLQRVDKVVCKGDRLMSVQGHTTFSEMRQSLKTESEVALVFTHTAAFEEAKATPEEAGRCKLQGRLGKRCEICKLSGTFC